MIFFGYTLAIIPALAAFIVFHRHGWSKQVWSTYQKRIYILLAIGLGAASPFLTDHSVGTRESYNYSLSVADTVEQLRAAQFPVLAGQSEYAFNGRIHPLRTAPLLDYEAGVFDLITFHRLNAWTLQNLVLAFSLIAGAFAMYGWVRRISHIGVTPALRISAGYVFCPGVLAAAYSMDLYMTVVAVPFVPIIVGQTLLAIRSRGRIQEYIMLGAAVAAAWWAHPPIALWASLAVLLLHVFNLPKLTFRTLTACLVGAGIASVLVLFVFASVFSIRNYGSITAARATNEIVAEIARSFASSIRPAPVDPHELGAFQLGYAYWGMLVFGSLYALVRKQVEAFFTLVVAGILLCFTTPVPLLTHWLWQHVPTWVMTINGPWPMQRLYLVSAVIVLFGLGQIRTWPNIQRLPKVARDGISVALLIALFWTGYQSWHYIDRGLQLRASATYTRQSHEPENIDLTIIAYAMLPVPPWFANGVMDPTMEARILERGTARELTSNWQSPASRAKRVQSGTLRITGGERDIAILEPHLVLEPGKRYRLDFDFHSSPEDMVLQFTGRHTFRAYNLPESGQPKAFGMKPENRRAITLWTSGGEQEDVALNLVAPGIASQTQLDFAVFTLYEIDPAALPIQLESLIPYRVRVHSTVPAYLETPRTYLEGYQASVNGTPSRSVKSPDGLVMTPIPAGDSEVVLEYKGQPWLRLSFWVSFAAWLALASAILLNAFQPKWAAHISKFGQSIFHAVWARKWSLSLAVATLAGGIYCVRRWTIYRDAAGPLRIQLVLPQHETSRSQPLVTTGRPQAGTFIFVIYQDPTHIRVGFDVWNRAAWMSDPIETDYFAPHEFVISSGALYPKDHPKLRGLDAAALEQLRNHIWIKLDGKLLVDREQDSFDSALRDVTVGLNRLQGSSTEPKFVGQLLQVERLPVKAGLNP